VVAVEEVAGGEGGGASLVEHEPLVPPRVMLREVMMGGISLMLSSLP
jgi:hypothetical protein